MKSIIVLLFSLGFLTSTSALAQDNYEIQVYGSELVDPRATMLELHSNFTFQDAKPPAEGVKSAEHAIHETVEITHGFNRWMEVGFYFFNSLGSDQRTAYVGSHVRPRFAVPKDYDLPVGLSLSLEGGFQKRAFAEDDWSLEVRPIVDKTFGSWYFAFNPTVDHSFHGLNSGNGWAFSPNFKLSDAITEQISPGLEYYGAMGPLFHFSNSAEQQHQLYLAVDLHVAPEWEINAGYGFSLNTASPISVAKVILGRRFGE